MSFRALELAVGGEWSGAEDDSLRLWLGDSTLGGLEPRFGELDMADDWYERDHAPPLKVRLRSQNGRFVQIGNSLFTFAQGGRRLYDQRQLE